MVMDAMGEIPVLTSVNRTLVGIPSPVSNAIAAQRLAMDAMVPPRSADDGVLRGSPDPPEGGGLVRLHTRSQLEDQQRLTGDRGILVRHRDLRCRCWRATVFVPSWSEGSGQPGEHVPAAFEIMNMQGGCL